MLLKLAMLLKLTAESGAAIYLMLDERNRGNTEGLRSDRVFFDSDCFDSAFCGAANLEVDRAEGRSPPDKLLVGCSRIRRETMRNF